MSTMIDDVAEFHEKFGLPFSGQDIIFGDDIQAGLDAMLFRLKFLREETEEFNEAFGESDRVKAFDAMLDLAYVALGTALFMGVTPAQWRAGWAEVHRANMAKVRVAGANLSKRGNGFDVVKPAGWTGPENQLKEILSWNQLAGD